ncbi:MAG TPA: hypothetical protein VGL93_10200 [Streptosporangiaceae bacterium]|jgi:hypothetical protein
MRPGIVVLLHSPLTTAAAWGGVPGALRAAGHAVVVPEIGDDDGAPYAVRYVARAALEITASAEVAAAPDAPVTLVAHSGAGPLLPAVGAAQRAAHRRVAGYVFADAGLPPASALTRMALMPPDLAGELDRLFADGGRFPDWAPPPGLEHAMRPRGRDFFTEPLPALADWPDAPCGYLHLSAAYSGDARMAAARSWPVAAHLDADDHLAAYTDPEGTAAALEGLLAAM